MKNYTKKSFYKEYAMDFSFEFNEDELIKKGVLSGFIKKIENDLYVLISSQISEDITK